jgi:acetoin utilization protein AcuC
VPHRIHDLAHELCGGRWVATGGGGYDIWRVVPRAWTSLWATVSHQEFPEKAPETWLSKWSGKSPVRLPLLMRDDPEDYPQGPRAAKIAERNLSTVDEVAKKVLPRIQ